MIQKMGAILVLLFLIVTTKAIASVNCDKIGSFKEFTYIRIFGGYIGIPGNYYLNSYQSNSEVLSFGAFQQKNNKVDQGLWSIYIVEGKSRKNWEDSINLKYAKGDVQKYLGFVITEFRNGGDSKDSLYHEVAIVRSQEDTESNSKVLILVHKQVRPLWGEITNSFGSIDKFDSCGIQG